MNFAEQYHTNLQETLSKLDFAKINQAIEMMRDARDAGQMVFVAGNGGSASTASHFMCDIIKGSSYQREKRFKVMALTDNMEVITAYANDVSYDCVFTEQMKNFAKPGDIFMAISGSGNSPNVVQAMEYANQAGLKTIALTGRDGGKLGPMAHLNIHVASPHMGRIEDAHLVVCHTICYYFMDAEPR